MKTNLKLMSELKTNENGLYPFPNMPCGVLPFFVNNKNEVVWGSVESNRVGPIAVAPPAGTQDILVTKDNQTIRLEVAKPIPALIAELKDYVGKPFSNDIYQKALTTLANSGYKLYLEDPLVTAIHETYEEHGLHIYLGKNPTKSHNNSLLINLFEFEPQEILAKRGTTKQKIFAAHLTSNQGVELKYTNKIESKIPQTKGREFYEKGAWHTLNEIKDIYAIEKNKFQANDELANAELRAFSSRIKLLEKIEDSIAFYLNKSKNNNPALQYNMIDLNNQTKGSKYYAGLKFLSFSDQQKNSQDGIRDILKENPQIKII